VSGEGGVGCVVDGHGGVVVGHDGVVVGHGGVVVEHGGVVPVIEELDLDTGKTDSCTLLNNHTLDYDILLGTLYRYYMVIDELVHLLLSSPCTNLHHNHMTTQIFIKDFKNSSSYKIK